MTTTITKNFHVDHSVEETWANLTDPNKVVVCVPGASLTSQVDENNYKGEVELKVGPVKSKYGGLVSFLERDATNKNMVPFDDKSAFVTSGIRTGVAAITSRGMKEEHMDFVVDVIDRSLMNADDEAILAGIRKEVNAFMEQFPLYPELG